jgi:integrase
MPADMNCLTATQSTSFVRARNAEHHPPFSCPPKIKALIDALPLRERTLVLLAASTGLRQSEIFGLKWGDIDFESGTMSVIRSIVYGVVGPCKTAKAGANASDSRGCSDAVEKRLSIHQARGLGFCK